MYYRNPIKIMRTTRLNDGILRVHRLSVVTPAQLHKSDFVFRFYVCGGTFDNPQGYFFYLCVEQFLALYALMGFLDLPELLVLSACFELYGLGWRTTV
jgi:hypothetical protein